ncbi:MAG: glycosyltransferase family 87 protein [Armatimonadota bacterium]|nr:glycosyltransferase family 87 protein [Armatimonadota bacterium]
MKSVGSEETISQAGAQRWAVVCLTISLVSLLMLAALQYWTPRDFRTFWGLLDWAAARQFQKSVLGNTISPMNAQAFSLCFKIALAGAWVGYALCVLAGLRGARFKSRTILAVGAGVSLILAVMCPPTLSIDSYGYLAHARLGAYYGLNPYFHSHHELYEFRDPVARFLRSDIVSPYGPLWTLLSYGLVLFLKSAGLWWQVVGVKLIAGASLLTAGWSGKRIADHFSPGKGNLTLVAIVLNPLFLTEGPWSGHNDFLAMALAMLGMALYLRKHEVLPWLCIGCSVAVKLVTAPLLLWLAIERSRGRSLARRLLTIGLACLIGLTPVVLSYAPFWHGAATLDGIRTLPTRTESASSAAIRQKAGEFLQGHGVPEGLADICSFVVAQWTLIALLLGLTVWLWRRKSQGGWITAWVVFSGYMALVTMGTRFPWYLAWPWMASLTRWDRTHSVLSSAFFLLGFLLSMYYGLRIG